MLNESTRDEPKSLRQAQSDTVRKTTTTTRYLRVAFGAEFIICIKKEITKLK